MDTQPATISPASGKETLEEMVSDSAERAAAIVMLEQRIADRTRKLSALYDILEAASAPTDLQTTITRSLERLLRAVKAQVGAIHLFAEIGAERLDLSAQQGLPAHAVQLLRAIPVTEDHLLGDVVRENKTVFIPELRDEARATCLNFDPDLNICIVVPIVANEIVRGALTVWGNDSARYSAQEEIELLTSVGEQLGVVVENTRLRQQGEELLLLEERNRLSRDLHDSVTQSLYSVMLFAEAGRNLTRAGEYERAGKLFDDVLEIGQQALKEMRLLVHKLRPSLLEKEGLIRALQHRLNAVEGRAGVRHQLIFDAALEISGDIERELFQIAHEALNNAIKHASADAVTLTLRQDDAGGIVMQVQDNGRGFDLAGGDDGSGLGLISMRERVARLGGTLVIQSAPGAGTDISIQLPAERSGAGNEQ
jgi:signal transduction histidine kinase